MARYYFDYFCGSWTIDSIGQELANHKEVETEVMRALPEIAKSIIPADKNKQAYTAVVRNEENSTVYVATMTLTGSWFRNTI